MKKTLLFIAFTFFTLALAAQSCLISSYPLNGNANDVQPAANHGTVNGATLTTDQYGTANHAYQFDGVNDYIEMAEDFDYPEKTVCLWFYADNITTNHGTIFGMDHNAMVNGNMGATVIDIGSGTFKLHLFGGGVSGNQHDETILENQWYQLTMIKSATGYRYYLNCVEIFTGIAGNTVSASSTTTGSTFGCDRLYDRFFSGKIDGVFVSNCALTEKEICSKYSEVPEAVLADQQVTYEIYPNPADGNSFVHIISSAPEEAAVNIYNSLGEIVFTGQMNKSAHLNINANLFTGGLYYAVIESEKAGVVNMKFVVK